jgi:hypothetical protein
MRSSFATREKGKKGRKSTLRAVIGSFQLAPFPPCVHNLNTVFHHVYTSSNTCMSTGAFSPSPWVFRLKCASHTRNTDYVEYDDDEKEVVEVISATGT